VFVLDDYSMLRSLDEADFDRPASIFAVRDPVLYLERSRYGGGGGKGWQGATFWTADNPPYGAGVTYFIKEKTQTLEEARKEKIADARKADAPWQFPTIEQFRAESAQREPRVILVIRDQTGAVARRVVGDRGKGFHRTYWNLRLTSHQPIRGDRGSDGPLAAPGRYTVELVREADGLVEPLAGPVPFELRPIGYWSLTDAERAELAAFQDKVGRLQGAVQATQQVIDESAERLAAMRSAILETPAADPAWLAREDTLRRRLHDFEVVLRGDPVYDRAAQPEPPSVNARIYSIVGRLWDSNMPPAQSDRDQYRFAADAYVAMLENLRTLVQADIPSLEQDLAAAGAPWTPGRPLDWDFKP
jgi:hypothetical protein